MLWTLHILACKRSWRWRCHRAIDCPKHSAPFVAVQSFEWGRIIGLWEPGWAYRVAAHVGHNVSVVCRCFQQWSVKHSHTRRPVSRRPRSTDARQDRCIVRAEVAARIASREEIRTHIASAVSPRTIGNRLIAVGLTSHVPLARLPLTPRPCQTRLLWCREVVGWRVEWRSVILSDESRFCLYASDGSTHIDLVSVIFRSAFAHDTQAPPQASWCGEAISYNSRSHLVFLQG